MESIKKELVKSKSENKGSLDRYFAGIRVLPVLSSDLEADIAREAKNGCQESKDKLIKHNLRFVVKVAMRYKNKGMPLADLVSEGNLGLIRAAQTYDPDRQVRFIAYAVHWIKQSIIKAIAEKAYLLRLPLSWNNSLVQIKKISEELPSGDYTDKVSDIASQMGIPSYQVVELMNLSNARVSLDEEAYRLGTDELGQKKGANSTHVSGSFEDQLMERHILSLIDTSLLELEELEREVIIERFGLANVERKTLDAIGTKYNLTKERIRQIEQKALKVIRHHLNDLDKRDFLH